jgi:hypothetical protein
MLRLRTRVIALFTLFIMCAVLLSGCIHADSTLKLNGDGSGSYTLSLGLSEAFVSLAGDQFVESMDKSGQEAKQAGGDYRHFDQDGYSVWVFTRSFKSISELNALLQNNPASSAAPAGGSGTVSSPPVGILSVTETPGFFVNTFHVKGLISLKDLNDTAPDEGGIDVSQYFKDARESVSITMPGWISNYDKSGKVQGNTVTYTVHYNEEALIDVTGGGVNPTAIFIGAGAGLLLLLIIGGIIFWRRRSRRTLAVEPALVPAGAVGFSPSDSMEGVSEPTIPSASDYPPTP